MFGSGFSNLPRVVCVVLTCFDVHYDVHGRALVNVKYWKGHQGIAILFPGLRGVGERTRRRDIVSVARIDKALSRHQKNRPGGGGRKRETTCMCSWPYLLKRHAKLPPPPSSPLQKGAIASCAWPLVTRLYSFYTKRLHGIKCASVDNPVVNLIRPSLGHAARLNLVALAARDDFTK